MPHQSRSRRGAAQQHASLSWSVHRSLDLRLACRIKAALVSDEMPRRSRERASESSVLSLRAVRRGADKLRNITAAFCRRLQ